MTHGESMPDIRRTHARLCREATGVSEAAVSEGTGLRGQVSLGLVRSLDFSEQPWETSGKFKYGNGMTQSQF